MYTRIRYEDGSENLLESSNLILVKDTRWKAARARPPTYWKSVALLDCNDLVVFEAARPFFDRLHGVDAEYRPFLAENAERIQGRHPPLRVVEVFRAGPLDLLAALG